MVGKVYFYLCLPAGAIILSGLLQGSIKQHLKVPQKSTYPGALINVTLLGTNDLHSAASGLGLKSYPELVNGGYSKLVYLINSIR